MLPKILQWSCYFFLRISRQGFEHQTLRMRGERSNVMYRRGNINNPTSLNSVRKDSTVYVRKHYNHLFPGIFRHFCLLRWRCSRGFPHTGFSLPFCVVVLEPCLICGKNSVEEFPLPNSNSSCLYRSRLRNFFEHEILFFPKTFKSQ